MITVVPPRIFLFRSPLARAALCAGLFVFAHPQPLRADEPAMPAETPWNNGLTFEFAAAAEGFATLHAARLADHRVSIAYASALLLKQPRTQANIEAAYRLLAQVAGAASGDDAVLARYLLARIEQDHLLPPRTDDARARYAALLRDHAGHPLADQAAVQLALLRVWSQPRSDARETVRALGELLSTVRAPVAKREIHYILGRLFWEDLHDAPSAIAHLRAGREIGYEKPFRNAEVDLMIAGLAMEAGDRPLALLHYRAFAAAEPRNVRAATVRKIISELAAGPEEEVRP